jgi:purine-nucleoside phosphorylase
VEQVQETVGYINKINNFNPEYGVILGSGLGSFTEDINVEFILRIMTYLTFPVSTVVKGALVFGTIGDKRWYAVFILRRVFHEGSDFPVRVMKYLGITKLIVSNALE